MGFSLKKIGKTVSNAVKKPGDVFKKAAAVATGAGAGFLTGGPAGALGAAAHAAVQVSKTGKGPAITFKTGLNRVGQGAVAGAVTGIAARTLPGALRSAGSLGKSGGLISKGGGLLKSAGTLLKGGVVGQLGGLFNKKGAPVEDPADAADPGGGNSLAAGASYVKNKLSNAARNLNKTPYGQEFLSGAKKLIGLPGEDAAAPSEGGVKMSEAGVGGFGALGGWVPIIAITVFLFLGFFANKRR